MSEEMVVHGIPELVGQFSRLDQKAQNTFLKKATKSGAKVIYDDAETKVHRITGLEARSLTVRNSRRRGVVRALVTFKKRLYAGKKGFYGRYEDEGHFVGGRLKKKNDYGVSIYSTKRDYAAASIMAGRRYVGGSHFLERAFRAKKAAALEALRKSLAEQVDHDL